MKNNVFVNPIEFYFFCKMNNSLLLKTIN